jgi:hypothetical protein
MQHRPLQHALESQRRLGLARIVRTQHRGVLADEPLQIAFQLVQMGAAGPQHLGRRRIVQQRQEQMFHGHELMAPIPRLAESKIDGEFQVLAQHKSHLESRWGGYFDSSLFHGAQQRMLVSAGELVHLRHLGFRNLMSIDPAHPATTGMNVQHHLSRLFPVHPEKVFQYPHHEIHGGIVVVQQHHLEQRRLLEFGPGGFYNQTAILVGRRWIFLAHGIRVGSEVKKHLASGNAASRRVVPLVGVG